MSATVDVDGNATLTNGETIIEYFDGRVFNPRPSCDAGQDDPSGLDSAADMYPSGIVLYVNTDARFNSGRVIGQLCPYHAEERPAPEPATHRVDAEVKWIVDPGRPDGYEFELTSVEEL